MITPLPSQEVIYQVKEVGCPSTPNQIVGGARARGITGGWWQLFKGGFDEHST